MPSLLAILLIEKSGDIVETSVKQLDTTQLYKKCGFKKEDDFQKQAEWFVMDTWIELYAKTVGKSNGENKYEFPPPVDSKLFYGTCALVAFDSTRTSPVPLKQDQWLQMYEKLLGGFQDLNSEDSDSDESKEETVIPKSNKTKEGYVKDGFVVDEDELNDLLCDVPRGRGKTKEEKTMDSESESESEYESEFGSGSDELVEEEYVDETELL